MLCRTLFLLAIFACRNVIAETPQLAVEHPWIRTPVPGAAMLAGYATLRNVGMASLTVDKIASVDFGRIALHESVQDHGIEHMRALGTLTLDAGDKVEFAPGGKHFMLMQPRRELRAGDVVAITITYGDQRSITVDFKVADTAPSATH